ncbi:MAG: hypothetical protein JNK06_13035 [Candidatus Accumulibacter phosphatis]|uniref:hypothetical protein n=1 Tax=Candidatus Accumulibacter phosphatis TaxID=327160 RepID=UPI001A419326|nr:hypothetical protein [Candidatus Accumulibacter phosphatis]
MTLNLWRHLPFLGAGTILATAPADVIAAMESKTLQVELAQACGLDVLPTHRVRSDDWESLSILPFPLVLRPDRASVDPSFKAEFVQDSGQLARFLGARGTDAPTVVAQPFVGGPNVVVHGARTRAGEMLALQGYIGRLKNDGVTVMLEPWPLTEQLARACREFAQRACLVGVFHFDLLLDPGTDQVWFLEVNARLGGTTAKVYASGYDEPRALLWAFGLSKAPGVAEHGGVPVVNRLAAARCAIRAIGGKGTPVDFPFPSRSAVFWQALRASLTFRDEVLRPLRPLGTLVFLSQYLR